MLLKYKINSFQKLPKNPVFTVSRSGWDSEDVADPFVYVTADSVYLYYDGSINGHYSIGYAVRDKEGWFWEKRKQILKPDNINWRSYHLIAPAIIPVKQLLLYSGNENDTELGYKIGLAAKSPQWTFYSSKPIAELNSDSWDFSGNVYQDVIFLPDKKIYKMWYSGFTGPFAQIGVMESRDGINWEKRKEKSVFQSVPGVTSPEVIYNGEIFTLYFTQLDLNHGFGTKIESVESDDGLSWRNRTIILTAQDYWEGQRLMRPNLSFFEGQIHLYYCAQHNSEWNIGEAIAKVVYKNKGDWLSNTINKKITRIVIKYELPRQTNISMYLIRNQQKPVQFNLMKNRKEIRPNVFCSVIDTTINPPFKTKIQLKTENQNTSPAVYELSLE